MELGFVEVIAVDELTKRGILLMVIAILLDAVEFGPEIVETVVVRAELLNEIEGGGSPGV